MMGDTHVELSAMSVKRENNADDFGVMQAIMQDIFVIGLRLLSICSLLFLRNYSCSDRFHSRNTHAR